MLRKTAGNTGSPWGEYSLSLFIPGGATSYFTEKIFRSKTENRKIDMHYFPLATFIFILLALLFVFVIVLIEVGILRYAYHVKEWLKNQIIENINYACDQGIDKPEFTDWKWPGNVQK